MGKKELHKKLLNLIKEESPFNIGDEVWYIKLIKVGYCYCDYEYVIEKEIIKEINVSFKINEREIEDSSVSLYIDPGTGCESISQDGCVFKTEEEARKALRKLEDC